MVIYLPRVPTDYYLDALNYNLSKQNIAEVTEDTYNDFINSPEFEDILEADDDFREWFELNHVTKTVYQDKKPVVVYEPSYANTYVIPKDASLIERTKIIDTPNTVEYSLGDSAPGLLS